MRNTEEGANIGITKARLLIGIKQKQNIALSLFRATAVLDQKNCQCMFLYHVAFQLNSFNYKNFLHHNYIIRLKDF